jgi:hypothetical protein
MKKKIIIIFGCSYFQKKIISFFKKSFYVIGVDEDNNCYCKTKVDFFINKKFNEIDKIFLTLKKKKIRPLLILSPNSDKGFIAANELKKKFRLNGLHPQALKIFFNKLELNRFLKKNKFNYPNFTNKINNSQLKSLRKNVITKPINSSGSRNVFFINKNKVNNIFKKNKSLKKTDFIVQDFIPGCEYMIDGLISENKIHEFLISKKIKVKDVNTVSQTIFYKENILSKEIKEKIYKTISIFLDKINYKNGLFHIELIISSNKIFIIDVAPRGPGFFVLEDYLSKIFKINILKKLIQIELGIKTIYIPQKKVFGIVHFLITRNGKFKKFLIKRINEKFKFEKFIKNNIITKAVSADNDRLASITYLNKNSKLLIKKFILIKKKIKAIYEK